MKAAKVLLFLGVCFRMRSNKGWQIVTIIAASASAPKNGAIISHTIYPAMASSPKKKTYSMIRLIFILTVYTIELRQRKRPGENLVFRLMVGSVQLSFVAMSQRKLQ